MPNPLPDKAKTNPTQYNIEAIAKLEQDALERRTTAERVSEAIARFIGSVAFLLLQILLVLAWSAINLNLIPGLKPFDPFPFGILALVISSESVVLTIFVLLSQNRMTRQAERRSHLDLQVSMLAEQELTTMLEMQQKICQHMGVDVRRRSGRRRRGRGRRCPPSRSWRVRTTLPLAPRRRAESACSWVLRESLTRDARECRKLYKSSLVATPGSPASGPG
jgi:uncharacterized membrane protein